MTDTNQLPEPELGYIKTDKSNQPAFSARQMREMKDTNQLPGAPQIQQLGWVYCYQGQEPAFSYTPQPTGIPKTHYWQVPVFDTEQARAQVQGEPVGEIKWAANVPNSIREAVFYDLMPLIGTKLYTTPQPAQASQVEVTDAGIEQVLALAHSYADAKLMRYGALGIKEPPDPAAAFSELRRAILAQRPERVPMTEDQVWNNDALMSANGIAGFKMDALMRIVRAAEAHHGITAKAKKEGV